VALFEAKQLSPDDFNDSRLTTIQTAFMGVEDCGWRVIGITPEALELLASANYRKQDLPRRLCRGHKVDRIRTTRRLFALSKPLKQKQFFEIFLKNDCTVIMLVEQNRGPAGFPGYIKIDNPDAELFSNAGLMGWKHRRKERDFLADLHSGFKKGHGRLVKAGRQRYANALGARLRA